MTLSRTHRNGKRGSLSSAVYKVAPFAAFAGTGAFAALDGAYLLMVICGGGAVYAGKRLFDRDGNARRELHRRLKNNAVLLKNVARQDRVAAPQMERLVALQGSVLESWNIMPEEYRSLLDDDIFTILEEIESAASLARRRAALRAHVRGTDRAEIMNRIKSLERDIHGLPEDSALRQTFETTLDGRRSELEGCTEMLDGISLINAQLESAESLLANLRGDFLTLDTSLSSGMTGSGLARLRERVSLFKRSLDEVRQTLATVPEPDEADDIYDTHRHRSTEELPTR